MTDLSAVEARRIAIAAQGLADPRPARVTSATLAALVDRLGVLQLDSVNVLARSHYLVAFSRLGGYDCAALDALSHEGPRQLFEYWGHAASLLPVTTHPLFRWRMARANEESWRGVRAIARRSAFVERVLAEVAERGPVGAGDITVPRARRGEGGWWGWSEIKTAVEWLFWAGAVTTAARRQFERLYDLPERVLPAAVLAAPTPSEADARRALVERAARALGVATEADLADHYRFKPAPVRRAIAELVAAGTLQRVSVEGWRKPGYLHADARAPASCERAALLSPFDSLIWNRERTERLFGMRYRIELYTPAPKRVYGYYVLPFLLGDELVGRVDLKADRTGGRLLVQAAHREPGPGRPRAQVAAALAQELRTLADWLALPRIAVARRGDLARDLARAVRTVR